VLSLEHQAQKVKRVAKTSRLSLWKEKEPREIVETSPQSSLPNLLEQRWERRMILLTRQWLREYRK
jgi:hypothetical protein